MKKAMQANEAASRARNDVHWPSGQDTQVESVPQWLPAKTNSQIIKLTTFA